MPLAVADLCSPEGSHRVISRLLPHSKHQSWSVLQKNAKSAMKLMNGRNAKKRRNTEKLLKTSSREESSCSCKMYRRRRRVGNSSSDRGVTGLKKRIDP